MQIDVQALLGDGPLETWAEYRDGFQLKVRLASGEEQTDHIRELVKVKDGAEQDRLMRDYWLSHVTDWRGLEDKGKPVAYDVTLLAALYRVDPRFRPWLVEVVQDIARFRRPGADAAAVAMDAAAAERAA